VKGGVAIAAATILLLPSHCQHFYLANSIRHVVPMKFNYPFIFYATYLQLSIESGDFIIFFFLDLATKKPELFFSNPPPPSHFVKQNFNICRKFARFFSP